MNFNLQKFMAFFSKNVYAYGSMKLFTNCVQRESYQIKENRHYRHSIYEMISQSKSTNL